MSKRLIILFLIITVSRGLLIAQYYYDNIIDLDRHISKAKDAKSQFYAYDAKALNLFYHYGNADSQVLTIGKKMLALAETDKNDSLKSRAYLIQALYYSMAGNNALALDALRTSIKYAEEANYSDGLSTAYKEQAIIYREAYLFEESIQLLKKSETLLTETPDRLNYMQPNRLYYNLSDVYLKVDSTELAKVYIIKARQVTNKENDPFGYIRLLDMEGQVHYKSGDKKLAETSFQTALDYSVEKGFAFAYVTTTINYCNMLLKEKRNEDAEHYALLGMEKAKLINNNLRIFKIAQLLKEIYSRFDKQKMFYFMSISDSISNIIQKERPMVQMVNSIRHDQEKARQEEELKHEKHLRLNFSILSIGVVLFLIAFLTLTRTIIVNRKIILFLGNLAFLLVFELISLLLHEYLSQMSLFYMFALLIIASSVLFPLHHHLQEITTRKLIRNNEIIRVNIARRILEELKEK